MNRWIRPALVSEGVSDDRFFAGIVRRTLQDAIAREFDVVAEIDDVVPIRSRIGPSPINDAVKELERNIGSYNLVVYHHDAGSNRDRTIDEWVRPMRTAWSATGSPEPLTCLVPVRETEAWTLADGDAIREVFGVAWPDDQLGIPPQPSRVSQVADPKRVIKTIADRASGRRVDYLTRLGELVSLRQLAEIEAYADWLRELTHALEHDLSLPRITRKGRGRA